MSMRLFPSMLAVGVVFLLPACEREETPSAPTPPPPDLTPELRAQVGALQKTVADQAQEIERQRTALEAAKSATDEFERLLTASGTEILDLKDALAVEKSAEVHEFAQVAALQQSGQWAEARLKYERFLERHPASPLASHARQALAEVVAAAARQKADTKRLGAQADPARAQAEMQRKFRDGILSIGELLAALKSKSPQEAVNLLGRPDRAFPNAEEWGYNDAVINPDTGRRGMLIITFRNGTFAHLRVDYAGRKLLP